MGDQIVQRRQALRPVRPGADAADEIWPNDLALEGSYEVPSGNGSNGGRDQNPYGFTMWLAGGGVKGGQVIGATDELGFKAVEDPFHVHDFHATLLELMGLDHTKLTYFFQGRNFRLTDVHGDHPLTKRLVA